MKGREIERRELNIRLGKRGDDGRDDEYEAMND